VTGEHVVDIDADNPHATIVADLAEVGAMPADAFDCFICTQTLHLIYDTQAAVRQIHRLLRPGGTALVTVPALSRVSCSAGTSGDFWRFTVASCQAMFGAVFGSDQVAVRSYGNVYAAVAFLMGMAREELTHQELETSDPYFPVVVAVRAVKR
jgi:ubiquinone/menaquinone biosynthesis C-methylase UbiE